MVCITMLYPIYLIHLLAQLMKTRLLASLHKSLGHGSRYRFKQPVISSSINIADLIRCLEKNCEKGESKLDACCSHYIFVSIRIICSAFQPDLQMITCLPFLFLHPPLPTGTISKAPVTKRYTLHRYYYLPFVINFVELVQ